jgi:hypothetical protein
MFKHFSLELKKRVFTHLIHLNKFIEETKRKLSESKAMLKKCLLNHSIAPDRNEAE